MQAVKNMYNDCPRRLKGKNKKYLKMFKNLSNLRKNINLHVPEA